MRGSRLLVRAAVCAVVVALVPVLVAGGPASGRAAPTAQDGAEPGRMVLVLDSSGSMKEPAAGGLSKIDAAKRALRGVVDRLPDDAQVGVRVFGATVENRSQPGACTDTQNVVPVGPLDRHRLDAAIAGYRPYGETPIGAALKGAAEDLGPARAGQSRTIVLLSDGEPTCKPDPCTVAKSLHGKGIDLRINVVGLDVSGKARDMLRCIARAGGGEYVDARSADELASGLVKTSVRALRLFRLYGTAVTGGTTIDQPLSVRPGRYQDTAIGEDHPRYYAIEKPKGGGVAVSALVRPPKSDRAWHFVVRIKLTTPQGAPCADSYAQDFQLLGETPMVSTGVQYQQIDTGTSPSPLSDDQPCRDADRLIAAVDAGPAGGRFQMQVTGYPKITNATTLPGPVDADARAWVRRVAVPVSGPATVVSGGVNLVDAPELEPGTTYTDTIRPGEELVYKVRAGFGQSPGFGARIAPSGPADAVLDRLGVDTDLRMVSALGQSMLPETDAAKGVTDRSLYNGAEPVLLSAAAPQVRIRNLELPHPSWRAVTEDGYYYFVLGMGTDSAQQGNRIEVPVRLAVDVRGSVSGAPTYAGPVLGAPAAAPADKATASSAPGHRGTHGSAPWGWIGLGTVVVLLLVAGGFVLGRRSSRPSPRGP